MRNSRRGNDDHSCVAYVLSEEDGSLDISFNEFQFAAPEILDLSASVWDAGIVGGRPTEGYARKV